MALRIPEFKSKGFASELNARKKVDQWHLVLTDSVAFVASQAGRFFPVAVVHGSDTMYVRALVDAGFYVTN